MNGRPRVNYSILVLIGYAIYIVCTQAHHKVRFFILTMLGSTAIPLVLTDLIMGTRISTINRYLVPWHLGVQLAVTYLFTYYLILNQFGQLKQRILRGFWLIIMTVLLVLGYSSCTRFLQTEGEWTNSDFKNIKVSQVINQSLSPLIISDVKVYSFLSLSHLLNPNVKVQLVDDLEEFVSIDHTNDIFLYKPTPSLSTLVAKKYRLRLEPVIGNDLFTLSE